MPFLPLPTMQINAGPPATAGEESERRTSKAQQEQQEQEAPPPTPTATTNTTTTSTTTSTRNDHMNNSSSLNSNRRRMMSRSLRESVRTLHPPTVPQNLRRWPRTFACCWGVLIPLNILVFVSLILGLLLGKMEMQGEIDRNDAFVRSKMANLKATQDLADVLHHLPTLCLALLQQNQTVDALPDILEAIMTDESTRTHFLELEPNTQNQTEIPGNKTVLELSQFFATCGDAGDVFREAWLDHFSTLVEDEASLTFNYIRCVNRSSPLAFNAIVKPSPEDVHDAMPSTQAALYQDSWIQNQQKLETKYLEESQGDELEALTKSYEDATGKAKCAVNMPSAAWFWFTVMSTVGYGNQVPTTVWGRLMTYTLGFASILMFGGILATAGGITTHLMRDMVHRCKKRVSKPVMILVWGICWLLWMVLIMYQVMGFDRRRLQEEISPNDAYWLAFITTTTVGFGDYYLQPEGLFVSDLLGFWLTFLIGFVFLSSFLTELSEFVGQIFPNLSEDLKKKLKYAYDKEVPEEVLRSSKKRNSLLRRSSRNQPQDSRRPWLEPLELSDSEEEADSDKNNKPTSSNQPGASVAKPILLHPDTEASATTNTSLPESSVATVGAAKPTIHPPQQETATKTPATKPPPQKSTVTPAPESAPKPKPASATAPKPAAAAAAPTQTTKPAAPKPTTPAASTQKMITFQNMGKDPAMVKAELYYESTKWGSLGHGSKPVTVASQPGHRWFIAANGTYVKLFTVGQDAKQTFTI